MVSEWPKQNKQACWLTLQVSPLIGGETDMALWMLSCWPLKRWEKEKTHLNHLQNPLKWWPCFQRSHNIFLRLCWTMSWPETILDTYPGNEIRMANVVWTGCCLVQFSSLFNSTGEDSKQHKYASLFEELTWPPHWCRVPGTFHSHCFLLVQVSPKHKPSRSYQEVQVLSSSFPESPASHFASNWLHRQAHPHQNQTLGSD